MNPSPKAVVRSSDTKPAKLRRVPRTVFQCGRCRGLPPKILESFYVPEFLLCALCGQKIPAKTPDPLVEP